MARFSQWGVHQTGQYGVCSDALVSVFNGNALRQLIDGRFAGPIRHARVADLADRCDRQNVDDGAAALVFDSRRLHHFERAQLLF